ncbi:hypothetical protein T01_11746 [Trichinella spiralis]|uniref:Uncharacterized protein n=1 Tax=Trichinella spiralis TaxID=6334 RepID=A0A0V1C2R9_TRISP|nr:hypothetical protein T01_11746 [Trichinella spiralis]
MVIIIHHVSEDLATTIVDNNQASMWSHCPIEDNPADMLILLAAFYSSYAYVICDLAHRIMKDAYLQTDAVCLFPAYDIWMSFLDRLQDYMGLIADRRYVTQIEAQTKNPLHIAMDKLCNELGMHCIALKIGDKVKIH